MTIARKLLGLAFVALPWLGSGCVQTESESEEYEQMSSAVVDVPPIPSDSPSATGITVTNTTAIGSYSTAVTSLGIQVSNHSTTSISYELLVSDYGLDQRYAEKSMGTYTLGAGASETRNVSTAAFPLQPVSHPSQVFITARYSTTDQQTVQAQTPLFYYHFSSDYAHAYVYDEHELVTHLPTGLGFNADDIRGRVQVAGVWKTIAEARRAEGQTGLAIAEVYPPPAPPPAPGGDGPSPAPTSWFKICGSWRASFVDSGAGDFGTAHPWFPGSINGTEEILASYAHAEVRNVSSGFCSTQNPVNCSSQVWSGYLDAQGCAFIDASVNTNYIVRLSSRLRRNDFPPTGPVRSSTVEYFLQNDVNQNQGVIALTSKVIKSPSTKATHASPAFALYTLGGHDSSNVTATLSRMFLSSETTPGDYPTRANLGCNNGQGALDVPPTDSCVGGVTTFIGPRETGLGRPGGIAWKYVIAHELGHSVQWRAMGLMGDLLTFGTAFDPTIGGVDANTLNCGCNHVTANNQQHCLQSAEHFGAADREGFAHFYSAKIWDDPADGACTFNYYKEFRKDTGTVLSPPYKVNCILPAQWRDNRCFEADLTTEYDWFQFLYFLNAQATTKLTIPQISSLHQTMCGGTSCEDVHGKAWADLRSAAISTYGIADPKTVQLTNSANQYGIDDTQH